MRINLKVARKLLLLHLARQPRLWDDALARLERQGIAEEQGGIRQGLARESRQDSVACPDGVLGHVDGHHVRRAIQEQPIPVGANVGGLLVERVIVEREVRGHADSVGLTWLMR